MPYAAARESDPHVLVQRSARDRQTRKTRSAKLGSEKHLGAVARCEAASAATVGPISRVQNSRHVVNCLGLNPKESSSGDKQPLGSMRKQGNFMLRFLLVEDAQTASRGDLELRRDYPRLKFRRGSAVAKVAIARKLTVRLYWKLQKAGPPSAAGSYAG